jgi:predicted metalloprotease with PDZ domain
MAFSRNRLFLTLLFLLTLTKPLASAEIASTGETIQIVVDATKTQQKFLHTHLSMPVHTGALTLYYPKWIPGEHGPTGPIADLSGLKFESGGKTIPWKRDLLDVYTFHLEIPPGVSQLEATYDYLEPQGESATDKLTILEWNSVLLYPAGTPAEHLTYEATLLLPVGWKFGTSLPLASTAGNKIAFKPISLDLLVDSPVIAGEFYRAIDITPPGEPVHHELDLVADSDAALEISPEIQKGMTRLVAESGELFGARHYRDYHFLLTLSDHVAHFGLEHHESNDSRLPERVLLGPEAGYLVGGLLPHEFVHSWNGKFRRPADLTVPYYEQPMETDLLWGYEGLTDYLGPMLAARSGLWTEEQYHDYMASIAASLGPGRPGRTWRTLLDTAVGEPGLASGHDGWLNWRRGVDYYDEGNLMWLEVATIIHRETGGKKSIDDWTQLFHGGPNNGPEVKTYTYDQLIGSLNSIAPYDWATFFRTHLDSTSPEAPMAGIENGGWKLVFNDKPLKLEGRHGKFGQIYSIGLQLNEDGTITDAIVGSPAFEAGISSGMKVAAVNSRIFTPDVLVDAIKSAKDNTQPISLLVLSDEYYRTFQVNYHGGERTPHLERVEQKPDYLDGLIKPHAAAK